MSWSRDGRRITYSANERNQAFFDVYVMGFDSRINFRPRRGSEKSAAQFVRVEEGNFDEGQWVPRRLLNGDQTFFGLRLPADGRILRVELTAY